VEQDQIADLLNLHHVLEVEHDDGDKGNFLFGWQCQNPFADDLLAATRARSVGLNHTQYSYLEEEPVLVDKIRRVHQRLDGIAPADVFCGAGATALLVTFAAYLRTKKIDEVYFLSPIYFSVHFALRLFGIRPRAISGRHAFEPDFKMNLPQRKAVLILTDPIWYAGIPLSENVIEQIVQWQQHNQQERLDITMLERGSSCFGK
jgi:histidinol-phosphate/aromatic aminotransferase/cobyric acid decarboxylase-like protein